MEFVNVASVEETLQQMKKLAWERTLREEEVPLSQALDRFASAAVVSQVNVPAFDRSTVDGYGVISAEVQGASEAIPSFLTLSDPVIMGQGEAPPLSPGHCVYVPTGGLVPPGADAMVMLEYTEALGEDLILMKKPAVPGAGLSYAGDDFKVGQVLLKQGDRMDPFQIGLLAAAGVAMVKVWARPRVALLSTGDEIIGVEAPQSLGQVRDINGYVLAAALTQMGCQVMAHTRVKDDMEAIREPLLAWIQDKADLILISGGSSVGSRDFTQQAVESLPQGELLVQGMKIKPGKPTLLARGGGIPILGLPGHPASAVMVFQVLGTAYLQALYRHQPKEIGLWVHLESNVAGSPGKQSYQMVELIEKEGRLIARPIYGKSGMMTLLSKATGFFVLPPEMEGLEAGSLVQVHLIKEGVFA